MARCKQIWVRSLIVVVVVMLSQNPGIYHAASRVIRIQMPSAWIPYLQSALKTADTTSSEWKIVDEAEKDADYRVSPNPKEAKTSVCQFPLATLAAVVRVESSLQEFDSLDDLLQDKRDKLDLMVSQDLAAFSPLNLPTNTVDSHEAILAKVVKSTRAVGLVRWQTAADDKPWPAGLRPLRINGKYPGDDSDSALTWQGAVEAVGTPDEAQGKALCAALTAWGTSPIEILAAGDLMFDRGIRNEVLRTGNYKFPFEKVIDMLPNADLRIANLECLISDQGKPWLKAFNFRVEPDWALKSLKYAGFDVLTLANNHTWDYGPDALVDTVKRLRAAGIATVGAGNNITEARAPAIIERNGLKIAFLGYVDTANEMWNFWPKKVMPAAADKPGVAWGFPQQVTEDVQAARKKADIVIVMLHSGIEEKNQPSLNQKQIAQAAIDAGATAVIGAHPHILQGVEYYQGRLIAYSLGNFVFDMNDTYQALMRFWVGREGVRAYAWEPFRIAFAGQPIPANNSERQQILQEVNDLTKWLNPKR